MLIHYRTIVEDEPGEQWAREFGQSWPYYRNWYLRGGTTGRPGYVTCRKALRTHMPELEPVYDRMVELAGGGDLEARFLSLYTPPPFLSGCSQAAWRGPFPALVRNYDYSPKLFEGRIWHTKWLRPVVAMGDCIWGALDGLNDAGLAVSLAFGGSKRTGDGFGVPLILRYVLEVCADAAEAAGALQAVPSHMAYNVTAVDAHGAYLTAHLSPGDKPRIYIEPVATNHQEKIEWQAYADRTATLVRKARLEALLTHDHLDFDAFVREFFYPPLYSTGYDQGYGTLYTAAYFPQTRSVRYIWPGHVMTRSLLDTHYDEAVVNLY